MKNALNIAALQTDILWEDAPGNRLMYDKHFAEINSQCDIIVLPEMFNTGFTMNADGVAEKMEGETVNWLKEKSTELNAAICGSMIISEDGRLFNRFVWAEKGEIRVQYDKRHLFRMAEEHHTFSPGTHRPEIIYDGWKIMPRVCYDLRFPVWNRSNWFDLQIYVACWPAARVGAWDKLLRARAIENQCYVVGVNRIGTDGNGQHYSGHSVVIDPKGNALTPEASEKQEWIYATINLDELEDFRKKFPVYMDADRFDVDI